MIQVATIGTSKITHQFVAAMQGVDGIELSGVYSRDAERAALAAQALGAPRSWVSLDDLPASPDVDAVYVASPNSVHHAQALAAIEAGKHVLVEKPAVPTAAEFESLLVAARAHEVVLLAGRRTAYDPGLELVRSLLPSLGQLRRVSLAYCQRSARYDQVLAGERVNIFDPDLAGGALYDLGVYCVGALIALFGEPGRVLAAQVPIATGADGAGAALAVYPGFVVDLSYSKITASSRPSEVQGELGTMTVDHIAAPRNIRVDLLDGTVREQQVDGPDGNGNMVYEIQRFVDLVSGGADPSLDQQRTLASLRVLDAIRASA